jgi:hypothetical protein
MGWWKIAAIDWEVCVGMRGFGYRSPIASRAARTLAPALAALAVWAAPVAAGPASEAPAPSPRAVAGTVQWSSVGNEQTYEVAVSTAPRDDGARQTVYVTVRRSGAEPQSYRPALQPGARAWVGISADGGLVWSRREVRVSASPAAGAEGTGAGEPGEAAGEGEHAGGGERAPEATAAGEGSATGAGGPGVTETGLGVAGTAFATANLGAAAADPTSAEGATGEMARRRAVRAQAIPGHPAIGANDAASWGVTSARTLFGHHITWDRLEIGHWASVVSNSLHAGFRVLAIVGNTPDGTPLSTVEPNAWGAQVASQLRANPGISVAEAGNETYYKGGVANPVQYGRMYLAAVRAEHAAGIHVPLLFNMVGDFPLGSWSSPSGWSMDSAGGGWLRTAVAGVPGLSVAIAENGISIHPYGTVGENVHDIWGVGAVAADEAVARSVLGVVPPFYITEFGYRLDQCGTGWGACTLQEQASKLRAAYPAMIADPHVAGIWWYESHDDSTGRFGLIAHNEKPRPAFNALSQIAVSQGQ